MLITVVGAVPVTLGLLRAWPQTYRILRSRDVTGLSVATWTMVFLSICTWLVLGLVREIPATIAFNVGALPGASAVLATLVYYGAVQLRSLAAALVAGISGIGLVLLSFGEMGIALLALGLAWTMFIPEVVRILRGPAPAVSRVSWWMLLVTMAFWGWYGLLLGEPVLVASSAVTTPLAAVALWRLHFPSPKWSPKWNPSGNIETTSGVN